MPATRRNQAGHRRVAGAAAVRGRVGYVTQDQALDHVAGYVLINDVSERAYQTERGGTWDKGKGCDTFGPVGPWLVTTDEVGDVQNLDMWLDLNGKRMQTGNTSTMIFTVAQIIAHLSEVMRLEPGDVIATGTPGGVGHARKPQRYLTAGQTLSTTVDGIGELVNVAVPEQA